VTEFSVTKFKQIIYKPIFEKKLDNFNTSTFNTFVGGFQGLGTEIKNIPQQSYAVKEILSLLFVCNGFICYLIFYQPKKDDCIHWFSCQLEQHRILSRIRWRRYVWTEKFHSRASRTKLIHHVVLL